MNPKGNTRAKYFGANKPHKDKFKGRKGKIRKQELYKSRPKSVHVIDSEINELQSKYGKVGWYSYVACLIAQWCFRLVELEKYLCILFTYLYIYRSNLSWMVLVWFWNTILFPQFIFNLWYELFVFQIQPKGIKTFSDFPLSKKTSDGMFTVLEISYSTGMEEWTYTQSNVHIQWSAPKMHWKSLASLGIKTGNPF